MSTAKSPQSTGQSDGSDDLIAELARMMASDAQPQASGEGEPANLAPAVEPQPESKPSGVRIPGPPENAPDAGKFDFDFGAAPKPADALHPAPLVNWQDRFSKPAEPTRVEPTAAVPSHVEPAPAEPARVEAIRQEPALNEAAHAEEGLRPQPSSISHQPAASEPVHVAQPAVREPAPERNVSFVAPARPAPEPVHVEPAAPRVTAVEPPKAEPAPRAEPPLAFKTHDFDFGFGTAKISEPVAASEPAEAPAVPASDTHDAIADLIAAEFDDPMPPVEAQPVVEEPKPAQAKPFLRAVNFSAQPKPQGDRFAVSPVIGVGSQPKATPASHAAPEASHVPPTRPEPKPADSAAPLDPMDEIESLIGSSIRNDLGPKIETRGPSSPIITAREPSAMPRPAARPIKDDHGAAEAAILAAAAASGAEVGRTAQARADDKARLDAPRANAAAAKPQKAPRRAGGFRPLIGLGVAAALLVVAGAGLYWVLGNGQGGDGTAPVLTADASPSKEPPPATPATTENQPASVVLNELAGGNTAAVPEQLVSRDQTGDTASVAAVTPTETSTGEEGLANRKVRTVTVRPDGTIVNADDVLAGGQALPVARPDVPAVPSGGVDATDLLTAAANSGAATPSPLTPAGTDSASPASTLTGTPSANSAALPASTTTPATTIDPANITPPGVVAPVPMPRLTNRPTAALGPTSGANNAVNAVVNAANDPIGALAAQSQPVATPAPQAAASSGSQAAAYVQLSSQRDEAVAQQSLIGINERYGRILGGVLPEVQRVDLGARGVYYRVRVPADSMQSANYLCDQIKSARGECFVTN